MLITMTDRGPDSAGIAIFGADAGETGKLTVQSDRPETDFDGLAEALTSEIGGAVTLTRRDSHAVLGLPLSLPEAARDALARVAPGVRVMSAGDATEIYKEVGLPRTVAARFGLAGMSGRHGIGHTRMATESAVTTLGAHPFSTGADQCLVHNGSLSNHYTLRQQLQKQGIIFRTDNDSEVAAGYLMHRLQEGDSLEEALERALSELDGFYTFAIGTRQGFAVVRDPIACKPAVMAETDDWVAMASEYRAIAVLPGAENAECWEPAPATIYSWSH